MTTPTDSRVPGVCCRARAFVLPLMLAAALRITAATQETVFQDDFGPASRGVLQSNIVSEPPPVGLGYETTVPHGWALKQWIIADAEPDGPRRAFWVIPQRADGQVDDFGEQAGRSHDAIAFAGAPVPADATHYMVEFRQWVNDNDYIGFVLGAREPALSHDGIEFGYERQIPGTDQTVQDVYYRGALGRGRIDDRARMRRWVTHRLEVRGQHVRWSQDGEVMLAGAVATLRSGGWFGIRQRYERGTRYDDVRITVLARYPAQPSDPDRARHHVATVAGATWNAEDQRPALPPGWSAVALLPGETNRVPHLQWWTPLSKEAPARLRITLAERNDEVRVVEAFFSETGESAGTFEIGRSPAFTSHEIALSAVAARRAVGEGIRLHLRGGSRPLWMIWRQEQAGGDASGWLPQLAPSELIANRTGLEVATVGRDYRPDPQRVIIQQPHADQGGSTSVRHTDLAHLEWKHRGYFQRNRDLGQVFTPERDFQLDAIVLRTGPSDAAVLAGAPGANVFVQFFEVVGEPRIHDNGTAQGTNAKHGFSKNHRCDDYLTGVEYRPMQIVRGGVFPALPPTRDHEGKATGDNAAKLVYLRWKFTDAEPLKFKAGRRYAFMVGFTEPGRERGFTLANANAAAVDAPPHLADSHDRYHGGWSLRREGDGTLPPTMFPQAQAPEDPARLERLQREALFAAGANRYALAPTTDGFPDVDTYRDLEFYLEAVVTRAGFRSPDVRVTGREFAESDGRVVMEAEDYTAVTGAWQRVEDEGRVVMRMNGPDGGMFVGRHMYLAYRIRFTTPGRYRLSGLMRSTGTKATDDVWVYWNREPSGDSREDYELKVETTQYDWSSKFKDLPPPQPPSKRPKNRDFAANGLPVSAPGVYTLFIAKGEEPFHPNHTAGTDADFYAFDQFALHHIALDSQPTEADAAETSLKSAQ